MTRVKQNTQAEKASIQAGIASEPATFEWNEADFARARPARDVMAPVKYRALTERRVRGPQRAPTKETISVRIDRDVLDALRASGPGWHGRLNDLLRKAVLS